MTSPSRFFCVYMQSVLHDPRSDANKGPDRSTSRIAKGLVDSQLWASRLAIGANRKRRKARPCDMNFFKRSRRSRTQPEGTEQDTASEVYVDYPIYLQADTMEQMQVLPYMLDPPRRRRTLSSSMFIPRRSKYFPFGRRRHSVLSVPDLPSYESMLRLDENNPKRGVKHCVLNKLPMVCPEGCDAEEGCLICLEGFPAGNAAKQLPCSHLFCQGCIGQWLQSHRSCPVCRFEFPDKETHLIIPK